MINIMEQKQYKSIVRMGHRETVGMFQEGDDIIITEKIDGANASFRKDGDVIRCYSRNNEITEENKGKMIKGFYDWVQNNISINDLEDNEIYFGEWSVYHKVKYSEENTKQFFLFDIYYTDTEEYAHYSLVDAMAEVLMVKSAPRFYVGEFISYEHLEGFVGRTDLGGTFCGQEKGEGIVIKNYSRRDKEGKQPYAKMVCDEFREMVKQKPPRDPNRPRTIEEEFVITFLTKARVEKHIHKMVDEGLLHEIWGIEDIGTILKTIGTPIKEDLIKEESDSLPKEYDEKNLSKSVGKKLPLFVKEIIAERENLIHT